MTDPLIRYATDPLTQSVVDAQAGHLARHDFICIRCGGRLILRQGPIRIRHFAHFGDEAAQSCPLYTGGQYEDLIKELRTSEIENAERAKRIRLIVICPPYGRSLRVCGILPPVSWGEIPREEELLALLTSMRFSTKGIITIPVGDTFHPSNSEALLELDPNAERVELVISGIDYPLLAGTWTADPIKEGDVFAGEPSRGVRIEQLRQIGSGETVFVFTSSRPSHLPSGVREYRAGTWHVTSFEIDEVNASLLIRLSGQEWLDPRSFYVDIVLPRDVDPRSRAPIEGAAGSKLTIAIWPPADLDPVFEVVSIPLGAEGLVEVPAAGYGKPRWHQATFPERGSLRLSVHWADRHRAIHLHSQQFPVNPQTLLDAIRSEKQIELQAGGITCNLANAWQCPPIQVRGSSPPSSLREAGITLFCPPGFRINSTAHFDTMGGVSPVVRREQINLEDLDLEFGTWVREGLVSMSIDMDTIGLVNIRVDRGRGWREKVQVRELKERIRSMPSAPNRPGWALVRALLDVPPGTPHNNLPGGIKKRVRRALREVRNESRE